MSIRLRLALFGAGVVAVTLLIFGGLVYQLAAASQGTDQDTALAQRADEAARAQRATPAAALSATGRLPAAGAVDLATQTDAFIEVLDAGGQPISGTGQVGGHVPAVPSSLLAVARAGGHSEATVTDAGVELRLRVVPWQGATAGVRGYVVAGQPTRIRTSNMTGLAWFLGISAVPTLLAALGASWLVAGRSLRPLRMIADTAEAIGGTHDLHRRLPERTGRDELGLLSRSFNRMLEQLEAAYERLGTALEAQRRLVADASHELRTPLTTIHGNAGLLALAENLPAGERVAAAQAILGESGRMKRMVEQLLTLARADVGQEPVRAPVDLGPLVEEIAGQARSLYPQRHLRLVVAQDAWVTGDRDALSQLIWILLDNAAKFTPPGGHIEVILESVGGMLRLTVGDDGAGVPEADLERIFERFYRADSSRSGTGAGLGLSIARGISAEHGGTIGVRNNAGRGCTFTVELPTAEAV